MSDIFFSLWLLSALSGGPGSPLPFWATANQWGLMPVNQGGLAVVQARTEFDASRTLQLRWGASLAANEYADNLDPGSMPLHIMADELYGSLRWKAFTLDMGIKHRELDFYGADARLGSLSTTGGHVAESGNARAMPGYLLSLDPVPIPWTGRHAWLYGAFGDYKPLGIRYVEDPLVHRTRIGFRFDVGARLRLGFLLDHYAIWGGAIPGKGTNQVTPGNYFRMVTGQHAGADGTRSDRLNVIGDQGGGELWRAEYLGDGWRIVFQHDIPYADGSGMGFQNFPDGVTTLHFGWDDKSRWVSDILYENTYTMYQSGPINGEKFDSEGHSITPPGVKTTGGDNYFNNGEYRSGWTHFGRPIGTPLMYPAGTRAGTWTPALMVLGLENNRLKAHHFALSGSLFKKHPYKLMLTYSANYGTYMKPYAGESAWNKEWGSVKETPLRQLSAGFTGSVRLLAPSGPRRPAASSLSAASTSSLAAASTSSFSAASTSSLSAASTSSFSAASTSSFAAASSSPLTDASTSSLSAASSSPLTDASTSSLSAASSSSLVPSSRQTAFSSRPLDLSLLYGLYADRGSVLPDTFGFTLGARLSF